VGDDARVRFANEARSGTAWRHGGEDRPSGGKVLVDLAGGHVDSTVADVREQEEQGIGPALQLERAAMGNEWLELDPVAETEGAHPARVSGAKIPDEAGDHVVIDLRQSCQEGPRIALS